MDTKIKDQFFEVEGHLKWLEEIVSGILTESTEKVNYVADLLKRTSEYNEDWDISNKEGELNWNLESDYNEQSPKYASLFAIHLNKSAMRVYIGRHDEASKTLEQLRPMLSKLTGEHERLRKTLEYSLDNLEYAILQLRELASSDYSSKIQEFQEKWELLQNGNKLCATICYLRGSLEREILLYDDESKLKHFEKVIQMDPDYHIWYHFAYQKARALRHETSGTRLPPSEKEFMLCKKAINLAPDIALSLYEESILLKDIMRTQHILGEGHLLNVVGDLSSNKCVDLLQKALAKAKALGMKKFMLKIKSQIAEIMCFHGNDEREVIGGLHVLLECLEEYPTAPLVHQRLGQLYHYGIPNAGSNDFQDFEKARYHLKMGLELNNFKYINCLREYIKLFKNLPPPLPVDEATDLLTKCLANCTLSWQQKRQITQIRIWRAIIQWVYHVNDLEMKQRACEDWLSVLRSHPDDMDWIMNTIRKPHFPVYVYGRKRPANVCGVELVGVLKDMKSNLDKDSETIDLVDIFINEVQKWSETCCGGMHTMVNGFDRGSYVGSNGERACSEGRYRTSQEIVYSSDVNWRQNTPKPRTTSEADDDSNWRVRK